MQYEKPITYKAKLKQDRAHIAELADLAKRKGITSLKCEGFELVILGDKSKATVMKEEETKPFDDMEKEREMLKNNPSAPLPFPV